MIVTQVSDEYLLPVFTQVKPLLQKALDRGFGELSMDDILARLIRGQQQLWVGIDEETGTMPLAFTTEISHYATMKHLCLLLTGAEPHTIDTWMDSWSEPVEQFCRMNGISHILTFGRDGWEKFLGGKGYHKYYTVMAKEIKDEEPASN